MGSSPFVRPKRSGLAEILGQVLGAIGDVELTRENPGWREDIRRRVLANQQAEQALESEELQQESARITNQSNRLAVRDRLARYVADAMGGWTESVPPQEQMVFGQGEEGPGLQTSAPSRGYAVNLPSQAAVPPDFLPPELAEDAGARTPAIRESVLRAARGKAGESKRNLEYLRAQTRSFEREADRTFRTGAAAERERRLDERQRRQIEARRAELRLKEGNIMQRHQERLAQSEDHYTRGQMRQSINTLDRADAVAFREFDRGLIDEVTLHERLTQNAARLPNVEDLGAGAGGPGAPPSSPPSPTPPRPPRTPPGGGPKEITTRAEFDALPEGARFRRGGKTYRKRGNSAAPEQ